MRLIDNIPTQGPIDADFVIVLESPSIYDVAEQKLLQGQASTLLLSALKQVGVPLSKALVLTALSQPLHAKDPKKLSAAVLQVQERVCTLIRRHPRKVVLVLGNAALWAVVQNHNLKITQVRGNVYMPTHLGETPVVAAVSASYVVRGNGDYTQFLRDVQLARNLHTPPTTAIETVQNVFEPGEYTVVTSEADVMRIIADLKSGDFGTAAMDIETSALDPRTATSEILCLGITYSPTHTWVIPAEYITNELWQPDIRYCWHNGKFDINWLHHFGYTEARVDDDTMLMSYALNERGGLHDLEQVGGDWLRAANYKNMLDKFLPSKKSSYKEIPTDVLHKYLAIDVQLTYALRRRLYAELEQQANTLRMYNEILIPASGFLAAVEQNGFKVDQEYAVQLAGVLTAEAHGYELEIQRIAAAYGIPNLNIRSPKQLQHFLYEVLALGPSTASTDADTLARLPSHPVTELLLKYRGVFKLVSTYVSPLQLKMDGEYRIHTTFKLHGTTTGRLSSSKPNMQNIPRDKRIRNLFVASPGHVLLEVDLAQAELRVLACLSKDVEMSRIFNEGISLHDEVATYLFGANFNKEQKMIAKNVNFGIVYGITAAGLRDQIEIGAAQQGSTVHVTMSEAAAWINAWYARFPQAAAFIQRCRQAPAQLETIVTPFGRKRRYKVASRETLHELQNEAANFPEQSSAHDITLLTGIALYKQFALQNIRIVNEVHDCLIFEVPNDLALIVSTARTVMRTFESVPIQWGLTGVPFKAEAEIGMSWGSLKSFHTEKYPENVDILKGERYV